MENILQRKIIILYFDLSLLGGNGQVQTGVLKVGKEVFQMCGDLHFHLKSLVLANRVEKVRDL